MITDNNKKLAQWAMDFALKNGCQAAKVVLYANSNTSFELRDAKMDRLQQASESVPATRANPGSAKKLKGQ